jgi:hypothetical protein
MEELQIIVKQLHEKRAMAKREVQRLDGAIAALGKLIGNGSAKSRKAKRVLSAAARRKIAAAQRARWARVRASKKGN